MKGQPKTIVLAYITAKDVREAKRIAALLLARKLIACANIVPKIESMYVWNGKRENSRESLVLAKTKRSLIKKVTEAVESVHSYDCPCIAFLPVDAMNAKYGQWLTDVIS